MGHGVSVDVATTDDNGADRLPVQLRQPVMEAGVTYRYFRRQSRFYTVSWPLSRWLAAHVDDYDLVHIHALFSFSATVGAFWANRRGVPYLVRPLGVLNTWGMENRRPFLKRLSMRWIERRVLARAAAIHFTSEQERSEAAFAVSGARSVIIPNPVADLDAEENPKVFPMRHPKLAGKRVILFLSRLDPKKGLDLLLDAFAQVRAAIPNAALVVAGSGEDAFVARARAHARRLGLEQDIIWAGFLKGAAKREAFAGADVFVLPSYSENFGIAVVEAMAMGLPVIVSDQVGIHQEVTRANAGMAVSCDAREVTKAILRTLENEALRKEMAQNARRLAQEFAPPAVTARLLETYRLFARESLPSNQMRGVPLKNHV